jgi:hypothetical protein
MLGAGLGATAQNAGYGAAVGRRRLLDRRHSVLRRSWPRRTPAQRAERRLWGGFAVVGLRGSVRVGVCPGAGRHAATERRLWSGPTGREHRHSVPTGVRPGPRQRAGSDRPLGTRARESRTVIRCPLGLWNRRLVMTPYPSFGAARRQQGVQVTLIGARRSSTRRTRRREVLCSGAAYTFGVHRTPNVGCFAPADSKVRARVALASPGPTRSCCQWVSNTGFVGGGRTPPASMACSPHGTGREDRVHGRRQGRPPI